MCVGKKKVTCTESKKPYLAKDSKMFSKYAGPTTIRIKCSTRSGHSQVNFNSRVSTAVTKFPR